MGLFSNTSPFDQEVEKATNENNTSEEWGQIMEICDRVGNSPQNAKDCLKSITKRLQNQDPHIVLQAITLLDACVSNCGKVFQLEVASREFESELRKLVCRQNQTKLTDKAKLVLKKWAENDFSGDPQLGLIPSFYFKLREEGVDFTPTHQPPTKTWKASTDPDSVCSQQEVDDIAKAIELSLKESGSPSSSAVGSGSKHRGESRETAVSSSLYPSMTDVCTSLSSPPTISSASATLRKVRALYDFEAAEDNELTFTAGEIINVIDDSDANWWRGSNDRGEGLFPSNFVTSQLSSPPSGSGSKSEKKSIHFNEVVQVKKINIPQQIEIDENKIDRLLVMFNEADPNDGQEDTEQMLSLEEQVHKMGPLIDAELEKLDKKSAELAVVGSSLVDAMNMYHSLMHEPSHHQLPLVIPPTAVPPPPPAAVPFKMVPPPQAPIYNAAMPPHPSHHQPVFNGGFYGGVGGFMGGVPPPMQMQPPGPVQDAPGGGMGMAPPPPGHHQGGHMVHNGTLYHHPMPVQPQPPPPPNMHQPPPQHHHQHYPPEQPPAPAP